MFSKVLVPLDGSEVARGILPYVSQIARGLNIPMVLLAVVDPAAVEIPERVRGISAEVAALRPGEAGISNAMQYFEAARSQVERHFQEEVVKPLKGQGLDAKVIVVLGKPEVEIVRTAQDEDCDLIAMSTHGRGRVGRALLGSVTYKVVHLSRLPTLIVNPEKAKKYAQEGAKISNIMAPLDGSNLAECVLPYIEDLALKLALEVDLIRSVGIVPTYSDEFSSAYIDMQYDLQTEMEKDAADYLGDVAERLTGKGIKTNSQVLIGGSAPAIIDLARATPRDLIVLTTHGRSGFNAFLFGNVAESLIVESGDPVLVIPPPMDDSN